MSDIRRRFLLAGLCLFVALVTACSSKPISRENASTSSDNSLQTVNPTQKQQHAIKKATKQDRKVTYRATIQIDTQHYATSRNQIEKLVQQAQGYLVDSTEQQKRTRKQTGMFTYRIPQKNFHSFINQLKKAIPSDEIRHLAINGEDVTEEMVDLEARLKAKKATQSRLLELMKNATDSASLLEISQQLDKVQEEIEQIAGRMQYLQHRVDFAQVTITLTHEKVVSAPDNASMLQKMKEAFWNSLTGIINVGKNLLIFIAGAIPILFVLGFITLLVYLFARYWKKRKKKET